MTRTQRLLTLLQILKENRYPITAEALSDKLQISVRSIYRDIESLRDQGAEITGEAGMGYQLKSGLLLPPLTFDINELEALVLGLRWVENNTDKELSHSALRAINKINAIVTKQHKALLEENTLFVFSNQIIEVNDVIAKDMRLSLREEKKAKIDYQDAQKQLSSRIIWPIAVGYFQNSQVIAAWCELRQSYRHFRLDRIISYDVLSDNLPYPKSYLFSRWKKEVLNDPPDKN